MSLSRDSISVAEIQHEYFIVSGIARSRDLLKIILLENPDSAIIFCNMRDETRWSRSSCRSRASTPSRYRATCRRPIASA